MSDLVEFLRARYAEARAREHGKRRSIPSPFDGHDVEITYSSLEGQQVIVDGHPYPPEQYFEIATEPAPDPEVIADLDAKQRIVARHTPHSMGTCRACEAPHWGVQVCNHCERAWPCPDVRDLAALHASHPDYDERWRP